MNYVKKKFMKEDGILGFHSFQSFKPGEVTPKLAHEIGIKLANEMWGDNFQVVVATHMDRHHIHNHFVINSVSFIDGHRYYDNRSSYAELRRLNDEICKEYNLSTLEEKKTKANIYYPNFQKKNLEYINYYKQAKIDLDYAIAISSSYNEFLKSLTNMGYEITNRYGKLSIKANNYKRNIRIERYYGEDYSIDNIKKQINHQYIASSKSFNRNNINNQDVLKSLLKCNYKNLYGMYIHYLNILKLYPTYIKQYKVSKYLKDDINKMDEITKETNYLVNNKIETENEFLLFLHKKEKEFNDLKSLKENMQRKHEDYKEINNQIKPIKEEIKMLKSIKLRKDKIKNNMDEINKEREVIINEYIK